MTFALPAPQTSVIAITPEIAGPGIEEEYADARAAINGICVALGEQRRTNDTPEGRLLLNIEWLDQQIATGKLSVPVNQSFVATIFHLVGSHELAGYPGLQPALGRLWLVLKGYGLMKRRHVPVLIDMIDDFIFAAESAKGHLPAADAALLDDMRAQADDLRRGGGWPKEGPPERGYYAIASEALGDAVDKGFVQLREIDASLFEGWRPRLARKPPLAAPTPDLPPVAPLLPEGMSPI